MNRTEHRDTGVRLDSLLLVLFIGLKLGGVINWSWLWVLSPLWIPVVLILVVALVAAMVDYYE